MSLVISSNDTLGNKQYDRYSTNQAPYRFTNHLVSPLEIDADSEVAVHSVKCNKDGLVKLSPSLSWYQFFNVDPRATRSGENPKITSVNESTGWEIKCFPKMESTKRDEYVSLFEFADRFEDGMRRGIPHPDFASSTTPLTTMEILRDSGTTGAGFKGFQLKYKYNSIGSGLADNPPTRFERLYPNDGTTRIQYTSGTKTFKALVGKQSGSSYSHAEAQKNCMFGMNHPLSRLGGECVFDLREAGEKVLVDDEYEYTKLNKDFLVGLNRGVPAEAGLFLNRQVGANVNSANGFTEYSTNPFDYAISSEQVGGGGNRWLKVGHLVEDSIMFDPNYPLAMGDIQYYKGTGAFEWTDSNFNSAGAPSAEPDDIGRYNMSVNASRFDAVKFKVENEIVDISLLRSHSLIPEGGDPSNYPTELLVSSFHMKNTNPTGFHKKVFPKPAAQTCWNLYPKVVLPFKDCEITLNTWNGKTTGFDADAPTDPADWYQRSINNGEFEGINIVDRRYYNDMSDLTLFPMKGTETTDGEKHFGQMLMNVILTPQTITYPHTQGANAQYVLGFVARGVLDSNNAIQTDAEQQTVYESDSTPSIQAKDSMFIRLDNFTQKSFNAGTGRPSKIIHHIPRFDTSNREIGAGLYFEPHEKTYIKLNNSNPIVINELDFSICNSREQLITDLTGETIICLHFRKAK